MRWFNPFRKPISELSGDDLRILRTVSEGWYIEYKRKFSCVGSAAKSLSAFANSSGGWLFYGIVEDPKDRTAGEFVGVQTEEIGQIESWLQQAASGSISPCPSYEHVVLKGPVPEIDLPPDKSIVVVRIPQGNNSPYIHQSGRIYRRVGNASDPIAETDRHSLELLWRRSQSRRDQFSSFVNREYTISEAESSGTHITLYFFPDPWDSRALQSKINFTSFAKLMKDSGPNPGFGHFDNIFTSSDCLIARQVRNNDPYFRGFIWRCYPSCVNEVTVPLPSVRIGAADVVLRQFMNGYEYSQEFFDECTKTGLKNGWLVDLSYIYFVLCSVMTRLHRLLEVDGLGWPIYFKARITGSWRTVPFFDLPDYISFLKEFGMPIVQEKACVVPEGDDPDSCHEIIQPRLDEAFEDDNAKLNIASFVDASLLLLLIGKAFGLHHSAFGLSLEQSGNDSDYLGKWVGMASRAEKVALQRLTMRRS